MNTPQLKVKYGLPTAIAMVIGVVAGSGVFFKAEAVLTATGGNVYLGVLAWLLVGLIMIICANTFSVLASRYERARGLVDLAEAVTGPRFSFCLGWFMATIYYPSLNAILAWITARYLCILFGVTDPTGGMTMLFSAFFLIILFATNSLAPLLAGKLQVSATIIKLLPLVVMSIGGMTAGLDSGMLMRNLYTVVDPFTKSGLFGAVLAVAFAYEGWIIALSINGELKDAWRNMPLALTFGALTIVAIYTAYFVGLVGAVPTEQLMSSGQYGAFLAFETVFGAGVGRAVFVLLIVSCIATCNGLSVANCRGLYSLAVRKHLSPRFAELDPYSNTPLSSSIIGLVLALFWLLHFYGSTVSSPWFPQVFCFDSSELPIITLYALYIPIFLMMITKEKDMRFTVRFVTTPLSIFGCLFMVVACAITHREQMLGYLAVFFVDALIGYVIFFRRKRKNTERTAVGP